MQHTTPDEALVKKYKKQGTPQLNRLLESGKVLDKSALEAIKHVLRTRDKLSEALSTADTSEIFTLLNMFDLDWEIRLERLCTQASYESGGPDYRVHPRFWWPVRQDNHQPLGRNCCDKDKPILQNKDVLELGLRLAKATGANVRMAASLNEGASILVGIESPAMVKVGPDTVRRHVYLLDNRTSEHGLRIGFGDTVLRCTNQLRRVKLEAAVKMKHTKSLPERIEALLEAYDGLTETLTAHDERLARWAQMPLTDDLVTDLILHLTGVDRTADVTGQNRVTPKMRLAETLERCINAQCLEVGQTVWGLFNGVTWVSTHVRHELYPASATPDEHTDQVYGKAGKLASDAYDWLTQVLD